MIRRMFDAIVVNVFDDDFPILLAAIAAWLVVYLVTGHWLPPSWR